MVERSLEFEKWMKEEGDVYRLGKIEAVKVVMALQFSTTILFGFTIFETNR